MPRTPIPDYLIHRPEEVERDADRFDHLCRLAEEAAFPVVQAALGRETSATAAEILTDEAKQALEALVEDAAILKDLDERQVLQDVQRSLSEALPLPDEEECRQHTRDFSQVLMGAWLETLRGAQSKMEVLWLSDYLIPELPSTGMTWLMEKFLAENAKLPQVLMDSLATFAVNEDDVATVLKTLRVNLFSEPRLVDLPFDLAMIGTSGEPVLVLTRSMYDELLDEIERQLEDMEMPTRPVFAPRVPAPIPAKLDGIRIFDTMPARKAVASLSEPVTATRYGRFAKVASLKATNIKTRVRKALTTDER